VTSLARLERRTGSGSDESPTVAGEKGNCREGLAFLDPLITTIGFAEIGSGLEQLRRGEARGRLVAVRD
jgi:hypothetical protein